MLIYDTRRHCLVTEAGIPLANAFTRLFYGVAHSLDILLIGASPASTWSAAVDDDLAASSTPMCRRRPIMSSLFCRASSSFSPVVSFLCYPRWIRLVANPLFFEEKHIPDPFGGLF